MKLKKTKKQRTILFFKKKNPFSFEKQGPKEFLYGLNYIQKKIPSLAFFSDSYRLSHLPFHLLEKIIVKQTKLGVYFQAFLNNKNRLRKSDLLFAINDGLSFGLLFFKSINRLDNKIIVLIQGLHDRHKYFKNNKYLVSFYKNLLIEAEIVLTLSQYERNLLIKLFKVNPKKVKVFYFGVDLNYWSKNKTVTKTKQKDFVLTLGNDMHRDYQLLLNHYSLNIPLKFITKILKEEQLNQVKKNLRFENYQRVSNQKLRQFYAQAKFIIVPLKNTLATSGLSVTLQAMAMGKPVLLAEAPALKELFKDRYHVLYYKMGCPKSFKQKITELNNNQELRNRLGKNSKELVKKRFNAKNMGKNLLKLISLLKNN